MIYFIGNTFNGYVKIGKTNNIKKRLYSIQNGCPLKVCVLKIIEADNTLEKEIHKKLKGLGLSGEWFKYDAIIYNEVLLSLGYCWDYDGESERLFNEKLKNINDRKNGIIKKSKRIKVKRPNGTECVRISKAVLDKVREHIKIHGGTISGFIETCVSNELNRLYPISGGK